MSPRDKAERCFALARSTTFAGERANAIAQGERIANAWDLSLDDFDIPGRVRAGRAAPPPPRPNFVRMDGALTPEMMAAIVEAMQSIDMERETIRFRAARARGTGSASYRPPRERCPHGSNRSLFGETCDLCARERATR